MAPGDYVPLLSSMAGVASPACIAGMMARGGVPAPLMAGHPLSGLAEHSLVACGLSNIVPADTATTAHQVSAQFGVSEHGKHCHTLLICTSVAKSDKYLTHRLRRHDSSYVRLSPQNWGTVPRACFGFRFCCAMTVEDI